ncbi:topless-related protein 1 isoform X2 [Selaginella moellendorffii]|uniref:topless-related protein 1 isoform X2 n=1 Tax=Selaginella moellendorffii TaxID=88036 RepID=UPI000D1CDDA5|nr:topless-related protein 1 isoform X2 [Selaginella moellendorffii]|eukprot:XP_024528644.1 topless-related protein 1 isoform X2 [Selaginella moellendorffii]
MSSLSRELVFLILQFLDEEKFKETVHKLEQESGFFFNMKYFEDQVQNGEWDEVERYLSGFTKVDDNRYSMKIFFEIRKQKYLEALDKQERAKAVEILVKDLKVFASFNEDLYKEITQLLTLDNFRENDQLSKYGDTKSARNIMLIELKKLIEANPLFREKHQFPSLKASRLRTLINQSLNWQHQLCKNPRPNPDIKTLFIDHSCGPPNGARAPPPANNPLVGAMQKTAAFPPLGAHGPFQPSAGPPASALAGWMGNANSAAPHAAVAPGQALPGPPNPAALLKRPRTPPANSTIDYQSADSEHILKRPRPQADEVNYAGASHQRNATLDDLPKTHARTLNQTSSVTSMDFHPMHQTVLLVGTNIGEISIWEVASREKLAYRTFKVWDISACSVTMQVEFGSFSFPCHDIAPLQTAFVKDPAVLVHRVVWSPDGALIGVAFSKFIIHLYMYNGTSELRQLHEIDAHVGGVNDLAFSHPNKQLCVITCGDDKTIKVWEAMTARKIYVFEGHEAAVYSVCPHHKESIQFIFSTALDGKIKAWLYDNLGSRVDYDAPGRWCTTMAYSADGTRLFSCGTSKDGESFLVEWNESEGAIKNTYNGFRKRSINVIQFDTTRNRFLAAGDDFSIKIWDMDNINLLTTIDADSGLPPSPRLRFNKEGTLLAVTTQDNSIRILANNDGLRLLNRAIEKVNEVKPAVNTLAAVSGVTAPVVAVDRVPAAVPNGAENSRAVEVKPRADEGIDKKNWKLADLTEQAHCRSIRLGDQMAASKVLRLIYTNAGNALLALGSNAIHKLWKWQKNDWNVAGKATANFAPQLWQPQSAGFMTNDVGETDPEEAVPCIALSKNDSYVMSASGGKVLLFNMMTFKIMTQFMPPPPAATFLAFHPQDNNFIAIGMEDSVIHIYNVRVDEVKTKLKGHSKRITGLAFSNNLNILVSSGADGQLCVWGTDAWDKRKSKFIQMPPGKDATPTGDTRVQFDVDQTRLLIVHETQLAIYDATKLESIHQWYLRDPFPASVSSATFSCDSELVYAAFIDGSVGVFETDGLRPRCRLAPSTYLPPGASGTSVYPLAISAHPTEKYQFALGLSDGGVLVVEPLEPDGKWGPIPVTDNGAAASGATGVPPPADQNAEQSGARAS